MTTDPQHAAPRGAPLPPPDAPRRALGDEVPPPPEAPLLPGAAYPAEESAAPEIAGPEQPVTEPPVAAEPPPAAPPLTIKRTRTSGLWVAVGFFAVILLLLLIFILQNGKQVSVNYLGAHGHLPLGVALLLSAVCGVLLVVLAGAARISQLRAVARRHRRADARRAKATARQAAGR